MLKKTAKHYQNPTRYFLLLILFLIPRNAPIWTEVGDGDFSHVAEFGDRDKLKRNRRQNSVTATLVMSPNSATATKVKTTCGRSWRPRLYFVANFGNRD